MKLLASCFCLFLIAAIPGVAIHAQNEPIREITQISGDLYRFQNNFHFSVFLVTDEGVIVTDPINADAAQWLKREIHERFGQPIEYLVYSHHHGDHVSGGEIFARDGATVIAHENAVAALHADGVPTAIPDETFSESLVLELGGKTVELYYLGKNHSDNSIVMLFPEEKTLFAVDFVSVRRLPYRTISRSYFPDYFEAFDRLAELDFEIIAPGHGELGIKQDALDHGVYLEKLYAAVRDGIDQGKSLEELKTGITLDEYADWDQYDAWREMNIEGMYGYLNES